jgi:uncharacterized repeat protein (TIGR03943 family)
MIDSRVARAVVVALWAAFFLVLAATGEAARYVGARTAWVVPFGAVALILVAILYAVSVARGRGRVRALTIREAVGLGAMLVPILAVLLVPRAALGSFAASRRPSEGYFLRVAPAPPKDPRDVSFIDIRVAEGDPKYALTAGVRNGLSVRLVGIVTRVGDAPRRTFELSRFYVSCCTADAIPVGVQVDSSDRVERDHWLEVTGTLERRGKRFVVEATRIREVEPPSRPYLAMRF